MSEATLTDTPAPDDPPVEDHDHFDHLATSTGLSNNKLGMWLFLGSECLLFGGLISTYMLYRNRQSDQIGPDQLWDIPFTSATSFVLLMSSLAMVLAGRLRTRNVPISPFEFAIPCEVFGIDRSPQGLPAFEFSICAVRPGPYHCSVVPSRAGCDWPPTVMAILGRSA